MLSEKILQLLNLNEISGEKNYLFNDFTLNWSFIDKIFSNSDKNLDDIDSCFKLKELIDPIIISSYQVLHHKKLFIDSLKLFTNWTCASIILENIFREFCTDEKSFALTGFLVAVTILEFSLGNVYETYNKTSPPHLLKDVLNELRSCSYFQGNQIFILQILLGTAKSCNLRNIAWHGFIESLHPAYLTFLFVVIISFGKQLKDLKIIPRYRHNLKLKFEISSIEMNYKEIFQTMQCNPKAWTQILYFKKEKKFRNGIYLLLPQIESILRFIYSKINEEEDAVTAQLNKYYVIMDSIFYEYILSNDITPLMIGKITKIQEMEIRKTHKRNKMLTFIPRSIYLIYYDLFYAIDGPRLRDKLSHGEVIIEDDDLEDIFKILLNFASIIVNFYQNQIVAKNFVYESKFLKILIFVRNFNITNQSAKLIFDKMEIPKLLITEKINFTEIEIENEEDVKIYFRPAIEAQIVKLMMKILENFNEALEYFKNSLIELFQQYEKKELSSSRRKVVESLIKFLPNFSNGFHEVLHVQQNIYFTLQQYDNTFDNENWNKKIIKLLKQTLQITEVYLKHFSSKNRNFFVANTKTCEFLQLSIKSQYLFQIENINQ
ncbi:hypothetical protein PVAND_013452 [Polypedilum vanderplanki]|uniref:DUF4209 domain-containing protein n=2 Tax=Polypedilum vanderplanki TaxID=319348 RepID=A0A9J6CRF9_POLVA|nr:hypothetical protein PVAND_013452 [Polypedilum vanderplanki]